ncbi:MAG TPA: hypothetical protein VLE91_02015 [Candidatus Saccharimonadales bacterium]|nr:hypothetical protein [Candidatus Saccharimonadales bacterium]
MTKDYDFQPTDQQLTRRLTSNLFSVLKEHSPDIQSYGLFGGEQQELEFDQSDPYGQLVRSTVETLKVLTFLLDKDKALSPEEKITYNHIITNAKPGICAWGAMLELIPINHLRDFPDENPTPEQLAQIARNSFVHFAAFANNNSDTAPHLLKHYFGSFNRDQGILHNWKLQDKYKELPSRFKISTDPSGRKLIPNDYEKAHSLAIAMGVDDSKYPSGHPVKAHMRQFDHCLALEVTTNDGRIVPHAVTEIMIEAATKWHYVHTIPEMRKAQAA